MPFICEFGNYATVKDFLCWHAAIIQGKILKEVTSDSLNFNFQIWDDPAVSSDSCFDVRETKRKLAYFGENVGSAFHDSATRKEASLSNVPVER